MQYRHLMGDQFIDIRKAIGTLCIDRVKEPIMADWAV